MRALLWPLFAWSARAQPATALVDTTGEGADLASVRLVGVGSATALEEGTTEDGGALASDRSVGVVAGRYAMALVRTQLSSLVGVGSVTVLAGR